MKEDRMTNKLKMKTKKTVRKEEKSERERMKEGKFGILLPCGIVGNTVVSRVNTFSTSVKIRSAVCVWLKGVPVTREVLRAFKNSLQRGRK
jgi:hypothetical protein